MARITRCSNCFNLVFEDAATCPHCHVGRTPRTRPRFLSRRNWAFIVVVLIIFGLVDGLVLVKEKRNRVRSDAQTEVARAFFRAHLRSSGFEDLPIAVDEDLVDLVRDALPADLVYLETFRQIRSVRRRVANGRFFSPRRQRVHRYRFHVVLNKTGAHTGLKGILEIILRGDNTAIARLRITAADALGNSYDPKSRSGARRLLWPPENMPVPAPSRRRRDG